MSSIKFPKWKEGYHFLLITAFIDFYRIIKFASIMSPKLGFGMDVVVCVTTCNVHLGWGWLSSRWMGKRRARDWVGEMIMLLIPRSLTEMSGGRLVMWLGFDRVVVSIIMQNELLSWAYRGLVMTIIVSTWIWKSSAKCIRLSNMLVGINCALVLILIVLNLNWIFNCDEILNSEMIGHWTCSACLCSALCLTWNIAW